MKLGRNDPCPCGSRKKYKHCCINTTSKEHSAVSNEIAKIVAMNRHLTLEELEVVADHKMEEQNNRPHPDFCGLSPTQMYNWIYAPFGELNGFNINIPEDLSSSPVMCYLALILEEAMAQDGSFKATEKGNLPTKLVKQASGLLSEFAVSQFETGLSISEFSGSNEDKFNALHYARLLAEMAGIIYRKNGHFHVKKTAQKQYQEHGIKAFFLPMMEASVSKYNWGYFDGWDDDIDIQAFWLFMLWRLQNHASIDKLVAEVSIAFPDLLDAFPAGEYFSPQEKLGQMIESRFLSRFLQFWGFVTVDYKGFLKRDHPPRKANIQPLFTQAFIFSV